MPDYLMWNSAYVDAEHQKWYSLIILNNNIIEWITEYDCRLWKATYGFNGRISNLLIHEQLYTILLLKFK